MGPMPLKRNGNLQKQLILLLQRGTNVRSSKGPQMFATITGNAIVEVVMRQ
jgi:hypothetical protein